MKRYIAAVFALLCFCSTIAPAWAGGDKVRGDLGQGAVNQVNSDKQGRQN
ncbi:MAG: hypothetical protein KTQ49_00730 [Candidatus Omnitrophica bacterium]|nr:hypothetical protein [Candidatus Omnitrophota bacterium]